MFDDVIRTARGQRYARRACYVASSSLALAAVVLLAVWRGAWSPAGAPFVPLLPVRIMSAGAAEGRAAPLPNARAAGQRPLLKPRPEAVRKRPRVAAVAMPRPAHPRPEELEERPMPAEEEGSSGADSGTDSGTGASAGSGSDAGSDADTGDLAAYPGAGWRRPEQARRGCVQESVRIPHDLRGFVSGPIMVRFAIGRDGEPSAFEVLGANPDARIGGAIWQAIKSCRWIPGADARGRPMKIWVIMPLRFVSG